MQNFIFYWGLPLPFWAPKPKPYPIVAVTHVLIKSLCHWWKLGWVEKWTSFEFHDDRTELLLLRMTLSIGAGGLVNSDQTRNNQRISYKTNFATSKLNHDILWFLGSCHFLDYHVIFICLVDSPQYFILVLPQYLMTKTAMQLGRDGGLGGRPEVRFFIGDHFQILTLWCLRNYFWNS